MHDLQWVLTVQCRVFKLISGLQISNSIFSKVDKMELEHYSIQPTIYLTVYLVSGHCFIFLGDASGDSYAAESTFPTLCITANF